MLVYWFVTVYLYWLVHLVGQLWCDVLGVLVQWFYGGVVVLVCWFVVERVVMMGRDWVEELVGWLGGGGGVCLGGGVWW